MSVGQDDLATRRDERDLERLRRWDERNKPEVVRARYEAALAETQRLIEEAAVVLAARGDFLGLSPGICAAKGCRRKRKPSELALCEKHEAMRERGEPVPRPVRGYAATPPSYGGCKGTLRSGEACRAIASLPSGYCAVHDPATRLARPAKTQRASYQGGREPSPAEVQRVRKLARKRGLRLKQSRRRDPGAPDHGRVWLLDAAGAVVFGGVHGVTLGEVLKALQPRRKPPAKASRAKAPQKVSEAPRKAAPARSGTKPVPIPGSG